MQDFLRQSNYLGFGPDSPLWFVLALFVIVFAVMVVSWLVNLSVRQLIRRAGSTATTWDDVLLESLKRPLTVFVWTVGITYAAEFAWHDADAYLTGLIATVRKLLVILTLMWFVLRFLKGFETRLLEGDGRGEGKGDGKILDRAGARALNKLLRASVVVTAGLMMLQTMGYSIAGLLTFGGIGGIIVGFAAKDLLANFFGGLMIYLDRPFTEGDWIRSPDREIEGTVEYIGWRLTRIRTFDQRPLYIPNSAFANIAVENPSRMSHRRINEAIGVRYDDIGVVPVIVGGVKKMLQAHPAIDAKKTLIVNLNEFSASSVDILIYAYTGTTDWTEFHAVKQSVLMKVHEVVAAHGAEIAFPTTTVHVAGGAVPWEG